jgi:ATP-binding cassette subfamily B protein
VKDLGVLMVLTAGGLDLLNDRFSLGDFFIFNDYLLRLFWPMIAVGWMIGMYHRGAAGMTRLNEIFDARNPIGASTPGARPVARVAGPIEIRDLSFGYNGAPVLRHVSVEIRAGETLGLTGRTGSGKSTLAALLPRLFEPERGSVFIAGTDVLDLPITTLRGSIGYVPQDTFLFSRSLRANLALGEPGAGDAAVVHALELAHLDQDVRTFERGLEQIVGERGVTLSGGQRQRATLARALLLDPPILVLDDCLSAVDSQTEEAILAGLRPALKGRTALLISHRISALSVADRIAVMHEGTIAEVGTHRELLERGGLYAELYQQQIREEELGRL